MPLLKSMMPACPVPVASKAPPSSLPCYPSLWGGIPHKHKGTQFFFTLKSFLKGFFFEVVPLKAGLQLNCQCFLTALEPVKECCLVILSFSDWCFLLFLNHKLLEAWTPVFSLCVCTAWSPGSQAHHYNACMLAQILKISIFLWKTLFKHPLWMMGKAS